MLRSTCNITTSEVDRLADFSSQYYKTYSIRLNCLSTILEQRIKDKWGADAKVIKLCDVTSDERCVLVGILYKEMENKPTVLKEMTDSHQLGVRPLPPHKLFSSKDLLFLEDSEQRILLNPINMSSSSFVTGMVVAVFGYEPEQCKGKFVVEDIEYPTPTFPLLKTLENRHLMARYIVIISGIELGDGDEFNTIRTKLFFDWICGELPIKRYEINPRSIGRLIVAGNSTRLNSDDKMVSQNKFVMKKSDVVSADSVALLDQLLSNVCRSIPVDIMTGPLDPSSIMLPQKPLHRVLFPHSRKWGTFNTRPNPWFFYLDDGSLAIGTSGQPTDDIDRYSSIDDPLDRLEATIKWGHVAPTAPDTLYSYPNGGTTDPLVMPNKPTLYFTGNQNCLSWRNINHGGCSLLVTVPKFRQSGEIAVVDLMEMKCQTLSFK